MGKYSDAGFATCDTQLGINGERWPSAPKFKSSGFALLNCIVLIFRPKDSGLEHAQDHRRHDKTFTSSCHYQFSKTSTKASHSTNMHQLIAPKSAVFIHSKGGVSGSSPFSSGPFDFTGSGLDGNRGDGDSTDTATATGTGSGGSSDSGSGTTEGGSGIGATFGAGQGGEVGIHGHRTSGLSNSSIAGIAIGSVLAFIIVVGLILWLHTRKTRLQQQDRLAIDEHPSRHDENTVAFAKSANVLPASEIRYNDHLMDDQHILSGPTDDPPAYEDIGQQGHFSQGNHLPLQGHDHNNYVLGSVSDGFRQYDAQPSNPDLGGKERSQVPNARRGYEESQPVNV